ncbi:hypothetical protein PCANC_11547 [Puccinia coronata f. sp. avenae]|uniref:Uncharacterized protein n=1 Tax=Puccinia coronata f. sp. avenae TaxID=200324 RepID=A0A2N5UQH9_9BASI|nr:hypothetical protein PCANC_11547 [Puccinia coronata f. sp. avenae]
MYLAGLKLCVLLIFAFLGVTSCAPSPPLRNVGLLSERKLLEHMSILRFRHCRKCKNSRARSVSSTVSDGQHFMKRTSSPDSSNADRGFTKFKSNHRMEPSSFTNIKRNGKDLDANNGRASS